MTAMHFDYEGEPDDADELDELLRLSDEAEALAEATRRPVCPGCGSEHALHSNEGETLADMEEASELPPIESACCPHGREAHFKDVGPCWGTAASDCPCQRYVELP